MRLDSEPAQRATWRRSTDGFWLYYETSSPIDLINRLAKHHSLYIEWSPYGDGRYSARFQLDTLAGVLSDLQKACHWTPAETSAKKAAVAKVKAAEDAVPISPGLQAVIDNMKAPQ
jgi:hypothetical protein